MSNENINNKALFDSWSFSKKNYQLFLFGIAVIITGYVIMATGSTNSVQATKIAPWVLTLGYCFIIPLAILYKK